MIISIRVRLQMKGRKAVYNLKKYQIFLVQTVERILIKKQINVLVFIIISLVFSQLALSAVFMIFPS